MELLKCRYCGAPYAYRENLELHERGCSERTQEVPIRELTPEPIELSRELEKFVPSWKVEVFYWPRTIQKFTIPLGEINTVRKKITINLWEGASREDALAILAHEYAHLEKGPEIEAWRRGEGHAREWGILAQYTKLGEELAGFYEEKNIYPKIAHDIRSWLAEVKKVEERITPEVRVERDQKLFPIKLRVDAEAPGKGYTIEMSHKGQVYATHMEPTIKDLEEWIAGGRDELDLYRGLREVGGEYLWLLKFLQNFGFANFPELAEVFEKAEEDRWHEITPEMYSTLERAWRDAFKTDWVLTWTPADVEWTDAAKYHREVFYRKHRYDELMAMMREGVDHIAKIKGISTVGRKTEVAQRIHEYDFGEPVPEWRLV